MTKKLAIGDWANASRPATFVPIVYYMRIRGIDHIVIPASRTPKLVFLSPNTGEGVSSALHSYRCYIWVGSTIQSYLKIKLNFLFLSYKQ